MTVNLTYTLCNETWLPEYANISSDQFQNLRKGTENIVSIAIPMKGGENCPIFIILVVESLDLMQTCSQANQ